MIVEMTKGRITARAESLEDSMTLLSLLPARSRARKYRRECPVPGCGVRAVYMKAHTKRAHGRGA